MRIPPPAVEAVIEDPGGELVLLSRIDDRDLLTAVAATSRTVAVAPCASSVPEQATRLVQHLEALRDGSVRPELTLDPYGNEREPELVALCRALQAQAYSVLGAKVVRTGADGPETVLVMAVVRSVCPWLRLQVDLDRD